MIKEYTGAELVALVEGNDENLRAAMLGMMRNWLLRGDGVAVYRNADLGHPEAGHIQFVSYGSSQAQLETDTVHVINDSANGREVERAQAAMRNWQSRGYKVASLPVDNGPHQASKRGVVCPACSRPPRRLPDIGASINWRYQLEGTCRGGDAWASTYA